MNHIATKLERPPIIDIVPDIETLSIKNTAAILSIGAVAINMSGEIIGQFYINIDPDEYVIHKQFAIDEDTKAFWARPENAEAKKTLECDLHGLQHALTKFYSWIKDVGGVRIWGNGAEFDNAILHHAFDQFNIEWPFKYYDSRCLRTLCKALNIKIDRSKGTHHNALDDAINQGEALIKCNKKLLYLEVSNII